MILSLLLSLVLTVSVGQNPFCAPVQSESVSKNTSHVSIHPDTQGLYFLTRPVNDREAIKALTWQTGKLTDHFGKIYDCELSFDPEIGFLTKINGVTRVVLRDKMAYVSHGGETIYSLNVATDQGVEKYYATQLVTGISDLYKIYPTGDKTRYFSRLKGKEFAEAFAPRKKELVRVLDDVPGAVPIIKSVPGSKLTESRLVEVYAEINKL